MTVADIDKKLEKHHEDGCDLADSIEHHMEQVTIKREAYHNNLKQISILLKLKGDIINAGKELVKFEPTEVK